MSTTSRGTLFEDRVFSALQNELKSNRLGISPKSAQIFRKKSYYSKDRESSIVTDISIEMVLPKKTKPTLIWIFECKDYAGTIPVNDIEEFDSKLQQIGAHNTKGTIVTSCALQSGAFSVSKSKGIGVIRLLPDDQVMHILELMASTSFVRKVNWSEFPKALLTPGHRSKEYFFGAQDGRWFADWTSLISHELSKVLKPRTKD